MGNTLHGCEPQISALEKILAIDELFRAILEELMTGGSTTLPLIQKED